MIAVIEIEFDYNSDDVEEDTRLATEHAAEIARKLTDNEPRVDAANVTEVR
jgi:hypothetical protein